MIYTDFIAAIDLGTSHIVGMVGTKNESGALTNIIYELEKSDMCMRRGCVYNVEDTAYKITALLRKLENKLGGAKISKVYIGIGGYSLHSVEHVVSKVLGTETEITESVLRSLDEECLTYKPSKIDVFAIAAPVYYLDGKEDINPIGVTCSRIEARYKLIVGRPLLRSSIEKNLAARIKCEIPAIIVSPLALGDFVLTEQEKRQGCILIDFGAGVTSVSAYKNGKLQMLYVLPFGSNLITRDIKSLNVSEQEAERLKRAYGSAIIEKDSEQQVIEISRTDKVGLSEIKLIDLNEIVEARSREIIENVYARLADAGITKESNYKVVISGGGSALKNMREALSNRLNMEVRYASARRDLVDSKDMIVNNTEYTLAAALLLQGKENCMQKPAEPEHKIIPTIISKPVEKKVPEIKEAEKKEPQTVVSQPEAIVEEKPRTTIENINVSNNSDDDKGNKTEPADNRANKSGSTKKKGHFGGLFSGFKDMFDKMTNVDDKDY